MNLVSSDGSLQLSSSLEEFDKSTEYEATYTELTPLQPLSPFSEPETDNYGYFGTINRYTDENQLHWFKYNKENDLMLFTGYEYLEPLRPISSVDGSNNSQSSISSQTLSLYNHDGMFALSNRKCVATSEAQNCNDSRSSLDDAGNDLVNNSQYVTSVDSSESSLLDLEEIDTKDVAEKVSMELKKYNISQVLFAQKILDRSQGTLSDLLRNPKPWTKLKSGRETFGRMLKWLNEPENERLSPLGVTVSLPKSDCSKNSKGSSLSIKKTSVVKSKIISRKSKMSRNCSKYNSTKSRLVFTDVQRRKLRDEFRKMSRPNREQQKYLSSELGLPVRTISNFFMNARRRPRVKWQHDFQSKVIDLSINV